ncbi:MAG: hypothetical protein IT207_10335 [Fimbriimonadaceae bacterium]|nr:hypothetical protein [Fimbriimonadaceae bacterium]
MYAEIQLEAPDPPLPDEEPAGHVKVSGTNVNVRFTGGGGPDANWNGAQTYDAARLDKIEFSIGSGNVTTGTLVKNMLGNTTSETARVRFASTKFAHGTDIELRVKAYVSLKRASDQQWFAKTIEHPVLVDAYNTVQRLATHEIVVNGGYEFDPDPTGFEYSRVSTEGTNYAQQLLSHNSLNHQLQWPTSIADNEQQESELAEQLDESTVNVLFTHGEAALFRSSYDDGNPANGDDRISIAEAAGYAARATGIPQINLTLLYACLCCSNGEDWAASFGAWDDGPVPNRALAGFNGVVFSHVLHEDYEGATVADHLRWVLTLMGQGPNSLAAPRYRTILEAVDDANDKFTPVTFDDEPLPMTVVGDDFMRLAGVYMSASEWDEARRTAWYWQRQ